MKEKPTCLNVTYEKKPCYDILITTDFTALPDLLASLSAKERQACIVSDSNVAPLYLETLKKIAEPFFRKITFFIFPAGEENKTLHSVQLLYMHLIENSLDRRDFLIALGGGVVGDLTGFAAATYLRGIRFIQIPTTLLSMIDSSIGGKTGVDFASYKNMVGAFYMPSLVYSNVSLLASLKKAEYCSGFGEMIKHALIQDTSYLSWLEEQRRSLLERDLAILQKAIAWSCSIKKNIVENDPKEVGMRAFLNFGHTIGHAIEKVSHFSYLHGECVAMGMVAASYLSVKRGFLSDQQHKWLISFLKDFSLPVFTAKVDRKEVLSAMEKDKKKDGDKLKFILLSRFGEAFLVENLKKEDFEEAFDQVLCQDVLDILERQYDE